MALIKITSSNGEKSELDASNGDTLMEAIRDKGHDAGEASCGGGCACATRHVDIDGGWITKLDVRSVG